VPPDLVWIGARYVFPSTFSYRVPYFSSSYAISAPTPSPSTVKLALVASAISRRGDPSKGSGFFEQIKTSSVAFELPERLSIFNAFVKRLKQKRKGGEDKGRDKEKRQDITGVRTGFERTFGIRGYVLYGGPLAVYIDVSPALATDIEEAFQAIGYFGTSDSICRCVKLEKRTPDLRRSPRRHTPEKESLSELPSGIPFILTDLTKNSTFDSVNPYLTTRLEPEKQLEHVSYIFPLKALEKAQDHVVYALQPFEK